MVYECKQMCSDLLEDGVEVEIMWIPFHVGLEGNDIVDERARHAALNGAVFDRPLPPIDFQGLARSLLLREWQGKWNAADTGRFAWFAEADWDHLGPSIQKKSKSPKTPLKSPF
jgi:hypothetical protein